MFGYLRSLVLFGFLCASSLLVVGAQSFRLFSRIRAAPTPVPILQIAFHLFQIFRGFRASK